MDSKGRKRHNPLHFVSATNGDEFVGYCKCQGTTRALTNGEELLWIPAQSSSVFDGLFFFQYECFRNRVGYIPRSKHPRHPGLGREPCALVPVCTTPRLQLQEVFLPACGKSCLRSRDHHSTNLRHENRHQRGAIAVHLCLL